MFCIHKQTQTIGRTEELIWPMFVCFSHTHFVTFDSLIRFLLLNRWFLFSSFLSQSPRFTLSRHERFTSSNPFSLLIFNNRLNVPNSTIFSHSLPIFPQFEMKQKKNIIIKCCVYVCSIRYTL